MQIEIVSATRLSATAFRERSALGASIRRLSHDARISSWVAYDNRAGLPAVYNARINSSRADAFVFVHDDVWIEDCFLAERLKDGFTRHGVLGVAGCARRKPGQEQGAPFGHSGNRPFDTSAATRKSAALNSPMKLVAEREGFEPSIRY